MCMLILRLPMLSSICTACMQERIHVCHISAKVQSCDLLHTACASAVKLCM